MIYYCITPLKRERTFSKSYENNVGIQTEKINTLSGPPPHK
jgi:hypothetical protein